MFQPLPETLRHAVTPALNDLSARISADQLSNLPPPIRDTLEPVFAISPFIATQCKRNPEILLQRAESGRLLKSLPAEDYRNTLTALMQDVTTEAEWMARLRRFRNREMVRIAWRDMAGWAVLNETLMDLSLLAEACIDLSLAFLFDLATEGRAAPLNAADQPQSLVVLGMGKLGAHELNFSSDIDLIFAYRDEGVLADKKQTTYNEFYTRLARNLVKVLDSTTEDGFVFRVDTRLRPFGDSGPLVMNFDGMELYYHGQAREWERYAMVKARVVAGDQDAGAELERIIKPFVYRRYLDYRTLRELRELKQKIAIELQRRDRQENVKLGPGGIREIEFIGQAFQLIRGGQERRLRVRGIQQVLATLEELGLLPPEVIQNLIDAYRFLRLVENRVQQYADQQTHDLPTDPTQRLSLAYALGYSDWDTFKQALDTVRAGVHAIFQQIIEASGSEVSDNFSLSEDASLNLPALQAAGWFKPEQAAAIMARFASSQTMRHVSPRGLSEINRLLPELFRATATTESPLECLERILALLESIASRTVYLSLLAENPKALAQLVKLAAASPWVIHYIALHPLLLDELLDSRRLYTPLTKTELEKELVQKLEAFDPDDTEQVLIALRQFKQANVLKVAVADLMGAIPVMVVSDYLTWIAEVLIEVVVRWAWRLTAARHGVPPKASRDTPGQFGVIAYGKMGGIELGYGSDLDLVFLYEGDDTDPTDGERVISTAEFFTRLGKRIIHLVTANTPSGILYEIDLRLRPSGSSGLLVSNLDAYETYQMETAWTWEQQALVKARFVAGDPKVGQAFTAIRNRSLSRQRDTGDLRQEVLSMREKMRENLLSPARETFPLKQGIGGIVDIEFLVQFGVLSGARHHAELTTWTDVVRLLETLTQVGFLTCDEAGFLKSTYCTLRERVHRASLQEVPAEVPMTEYLESRSRVTQIWQRIMVQDHTPAGAP